VEKTACRAADQKSNSDCRQDKRETKQEGREDKRGNQAPMREGPCAWGRRTQPLICLTH
jgi:hypothetical protein